MAVLNTPNSGVGLVSGADRDFRQPGVARGYVKDQVMIKMTPTSPESPFKDARVWLLRNVDGYKAWEGFSNAAGWYLARGLEIGIEYLAIATDPTKEHKATAAGVVVAVALEDL